VVEIPSALWMPLLHGFILRTRPAKSAQRYASIWGKDGSPLLVHSLRQKVLLHGFLGERMKALGLPADHAQVELGMRYGQP
jgi:protoporphyrin/coproporphyrin ferrochelatase